MDMRDQVQKFERSTSDVSRSGQLLGPKIPEIFRNINEGHSVTFRRLDQTARGRLAKKKRNIGETFCWPWNCGQQKEQSAGPDLSTVSRSLSDNIPVYSRRVLGSDRTLSFYLKHLRFNGSLVQACLLHLWTFGNVVRTSIFFASSLVLFLVVCVTAESVFCRLVSSFRRSFLLRLSTGNKLPESWSPCWVLVWVDCDHKAAKSAAESWTWNRRIDAPERNAIVSTGWFVFVIYWIFDRVQCAQPFLR